jgi:thiol-disulfide isomerase/thioredoxin
MRVRWAVAAVGVVALAAVAVNFYMPWRALDKPMPLASNSGRSGAANTDVADAVACPADAKPARFDFTLKDVDGRSVALSQYKGKVILLDFWATWCGPCKIEIPGFIEFQAKYGKDGLQVIGVSVDDTPEQLAPYVKQLKMNYLVLQGLGHDDVQDAYGPLVGIPTTVLISRDGKVCATHAGFAAKETFEREIKALL